MITFSTEFPLASGIGTDAVLRLACEWVTGSPHTSFAESSFAATPTNDAIELRAGNETATIASVVTGSSEMAGLLYRRIDAGLEWSTSIVARREGGETLFSVLVSCESFGTAVSLPQAKKPYIIKQVLRTLGGGEDGVIPVTDKAFELGEAHASAAAALIEGVAKNRLPIVYVSAGFDGEPAIDANSLAAYVSGLAHVVVEPSRAFSSKLRELVDGRNVYGGTVGVYWPQSRARKSYYLSMFENDARALQRTLSDDLRLALSNRRLSSRCTWAHLQEELSRYRVTQLREQGSSSLNDYVEAFDAELRAKETRLKEAEDEIQRLNAEIRRISASNSSIATSGGGILVLGKEHDLYPNEVRDTVISILQASLSGVRKNSRREHIVHDLMEANPHSNHAAELAKGVKAILKDYRTMDARIRGELIRLGFSLSEDGKHFKIVYHGDPRYMFVLPKTSSDYRAGRNAASDITGILF